MNEIKIKRILETRALPTLIEQRNNLLDEMDNLLNKAKEEKVKPYFVYNNEMMEEIIKMKPKNEEELIAIRGFGPVKIEKYGQDIIDIIKL